MNQEKIGKLIKEIRKNNNLTQDEFAKMFGVTYQAVSKWENGKNIPDIAILREISKKFNIDLSDLVEGEKNFKNKKKFFWIIFTIVLLVLILFIYKSQSNSFEFRQVSTTCEKFKITGSIAYSKDKTSIYISNVDYCGPKDTKEYKKISCSLYEDFDDKKTLISKCAEKENITIDNYLENLTISVDNYSSVCKNINKASLYIILSVDDKDNNVGIKHKIPITLKDNC